MMKKSYKMNATDKAYLPAIAKGLGLTLKHLFGKKFTLQYPEERREVAPIYRGVHRLNKDDKGRVKCVACFMCSTACPAHCITIIGAPSPWPDREKYPKVFEIDELRCIFCGFCEEACPEEAIELTEILDFSGYSRDEMIFDKEKLLRIYDLTKDKTHRETKEYLTKG